MRRRSQSLLAAAEQRAHPQRRPERPRPHWTSSKTKRQPASSHAFRRPARNSVEPGEGIVTGLV